MRLAIFSGEKPRLDCPFEHHPYSPGAEPSFVRNLDVGLLPLIEEEFTRGKSPIKAIQYLSCGVPVVGNVTGATSEILNNQNSFTVSSDAEWIKALEAMILDGNLRSSLGVAGRSFVLKHHNMETVKGQMLQLFLESPTP